MIPKFEVDTTLVVYGEMDAPLSDSTVISLANFFDFTDYNPHDRIFNILFYHHLNNIAVGLNPRTYLESRTSNRMKLFQKLVKVNSKHLFDGGRCTLDSNV